MRKTSILLLFLVSALVHAEALYQFKTSAQEEQFNLLLKNLRCLVCQNQDLADSNASLAKDLRQQVYTLVQANKSNHEIRTYLIERYGEFVVFYPSFKGLTYALWLGPVFFLIVGLLFFRRLTKRSRGLV